TFPGRPVSLLVIDGGKTLVVQNKNSLVFIDIATQKVKQMVASPVGLSVIGLAGDDRRVVTSDAKDHVRIAERQADGSFQWTGSIALVKPKAEGLAHPAGMVLVGENDL